MCSEGRKYVLKKELMFRVMVFFLAAARFADIWSRFIAFLRG